MTVSQQTLDHAKSLIEEAQGLKLTVYIDSEGYRTIGYGHKIEPNENIPDTITHERALELLRKDMQIATKRTIKTIGEQSFKKLSAQRQAVLIDLSFNLGQFKFPAMKKQIQNGNFDKAAFEMGQSKYRVQTKARAYRNMYIMKNNIMMNRQQGLEKALHDNLIQKDKNGKILYSNMVKDPLLKNLYQNNQCKNTDADLAKMIDQVKKMDIGGVSFDIDPVCTRLNGFIIDQKFTKVIQASINDPTNISLLDLVVPLKIMYDPQIPSKNISVSLDPLIPTQPDGPWYKKVFYPLQLSNTDYGQDMIEADYLMKQLSLGVDENNQPYPYPQQLKQIGIDVESIFKFVQHKSFEGSRTRLWIVIKDYEVGVNERFFQVKKIKMGVELKALECSKRIPIDLDLINKLYEKQKREYVENLPRLQNKLTKQESNKIIQMSVLGGCSFDISNIQSKLSDLQKQVSQAREIFVKKALNSNSLPLKIVDKQNIGNFNFICNQKMEIQNNKLYPFLFQSLVKCKHCGKAVNMDYYSVQNKQCVEHSSMKCNICSQLVLPGQAYKMNSDKSMVFHDKCFKCTGCGKNVEGPFAKIDGGQYHPECIPKKSVGACEECKKQIYQGQKYAQNPQTSAKYHADCAALVNKRIMDAIPSCKGCNVKIQGQYVKYQGQSYHEECAKKKAGIK